MVQEITLLAAHQNANGSPWTEMSFCVIRYICCCLLFVNLFKLTLRFYHQLARAQYQRQPFKEHEDYGPEHGDFKGCHKWMQEGWDKVVSLIAEEQPTTTSFSSESICPASPLRKLYHMYLFQNTHVPFITRGDLGGNSPQPMSKEGESGLLANSACEG